MIRGSDRVWLPRQVRNKTYHWIHGELSDGKSKRNKSKNPIYYSPPFSDTFDETPRPLGDVPAAHGSGIRALVVQEDERMERSCCRVRARPWWERRLHAAPRHTQQPTTAAPAVSDGGITAPSLYQKAQWVDSLLTESGVIRRFLTHGKTQITHLFHQQHKLGTKNYKIFFRFFFSKVYHVN